MCLTAPWVFLLDSLPVMLQTDMRFGSRNCVLPHALKLTKAAIHAGHFWGGSDALFNNWVCNNSPNQTAQRESTDGSLTQATAHICDQTTKDFLWRGVVRPAICTKGNTEHCTCDYVTTHTHISINTHWHWQTCVSAVVQCWNIQHHWSGFLRWELMTALWPHNDLEMNVCLYKSYNVPNIPSLTH